jgi:hypothetical protein
LQILIFSVRILPRLAALLLAALATLWSRPAAAAARVAVVLAPPESPSHPLESELPSSLQGQLRELDVDVAIVRAPRATLGPAALRAKKLAASEHAIAVIWLELRPTDVSVLLYQANGHLYARDLAVDGSAASQSEAIAIILRSAIAAILEGSSVGMTEIQLPAPPAPPAPPASSAPPPRAPRRGDRASVRAGASYVGSLFARKTAWEHGAALVLTAAPPASRWFFGLDYTHFVALELTSAEVTAKIRRHPVEVFTGITQRSSWASWQVTGALSADYVVRTTERTAEGLVPAAPSGRWLWAISTRLGVMVPIATRVDTVAQLGAEFLLNPFHQVIGDTNVGNQVLGSPLLARPRVELGVLISVW